MKRPLLWLVILATGLGVAGVLLARDWAKETARPVAPVVPADRYAPTQIAADGVVEGARPESALRSERIGVLKTVCVRENQDVHEGELLAELHNDSEMQQVALAKAELALAQAERDRLKNGERAETRQATAALEQAKRVALQQATADWKRNQRLAEQNTISREECDRSYFTMTRAQAELDAATAERRRVEAPARADEMAAADSRIASAEAKLHLAEAELAKTRLMAPISGRVLQVFAEPGELAGPSTPQPVLMLADLSRRRVRAFVEELDAPRVQVGQMAEVTADGLPGQVFTGCVTEVSSRMGKRALRTDEPGEYKDLYFREVMIDLDAGNELPVSLRVQARISPVPNEKR